MLAVLAWIVIVAKVIELMLMPSLFGKTRSRIVWSYTDWISAFISAWIVLPLAAHALGWI